MLAQSTSVFTDGARRMKRSRLATTKKIRTSPATRKTRGGTKSGRKRFIHLPTNCRNGKQERDDQNAFALRDRKDARKQHQGNQSRNNKFATFDFLHKRRTGKEETESNE